MSLSPCLSLALWLMKADAGIPAFGADKTHEYFKEIGWAQRAMAWLLKLGCAYKERRESRGEAERERESFLKGILLCTLVTTDFIEFQTSVSL